MLAGQPLAFGLSLLARGLVILLWASVPALVDSQSKASGWGLTVAMVTVELVAWMALFGELAVRR